MVKILNAPQSSVQSVSKLYDYHVFEASYYNKQYNYICHIFDHLNEMADEYFYVIKQITFALVTFNAFTNNL